MTTMTTEHVVLELLYLLGKEQEYKQTPKWTCTREFTLDTDLQQTKPTFTVDTRWL
jgi:hypothetical protein